MLEPSDSRESKDMIKIALKSVRNMIHLFDKNDNKGMSFKGIVDCYERKNRNKRLCKRCKQICMLPVVSKIEDKS